VVCHQKDLELRLLFLLGEVDQRPQISVLNLEVDPRHNVDRDLDPRHNVDRDLDPRHNVDRDLDPRHNVDRDLEQWHQLEHLLVEVQSLLVQKNVHQLLF